MLQFPNTMSWIRDLKYYSQQVDVNGPSTAPVYQYLKSNSGGFLGDLIKWNFEKFLVDKNGKVAERYPPTTSPLQIEVHASNISLISVSICWPAFTFFLPVFRRILRSFLQHKKSKILYKQWWEWVPEKYVWVNRQ